MTERLAEIESRLASIRELHGIVSAMRGLAAMRIQEAERNLTSTRAYAEIVRGSLLQAIGLSPDKAETPRRRGDSRIGVVLFGAEHGLAGDFNGRVIAGLGPVDTDALFVVGMRGAANCAERGLRVAWSYPMATHVGAIMTTARHISEELYRRFSRRELTGIAIVAARFTGGTRSTVMRQSVLPVEAPPRIARGGSPPLINLPSLALIERMLEEYLFAELAHAAMESFASENAARLATMQAARRNVEQKLDELTTVARSVRQDEITAELLDIVTGTEAAAAL